MERRLTIYVDIDNTICHTQGSDYENSIPIPEHIDKINKLFDEGHEIVYWTARGQQSKHDYKMFTFNQLHSWNCKYTSLIMNHKPSYDLLICDKSKRIEEI